MKKLTTIIEIEFDLPDEQNSKELLEEYEEGVYNLIKYNTDNDAKVNVKITVSE